MNHSLLANCVLAVCLASCLENEEEITVRPDGSVSVRMSSHGKPEDLADGYPIPLGAPWISDSDMVATWVRDVGADTGSVGVRENLRQLAPGSSELTTDDDVVLAVRADFASANDIPRWIAPPSEPYRTAYVERSTSVRVETKSGRQVYTFERVFNARTFERFSLWGALENRVSKELEHKMDQLKGGGEALTADERAGLIDVVLSSLTDTSIAYAETALLAVYTAGDASLDPRAVETVLRSVQESLATVIHRERIAALVDRFLAEASSNGERDDEAAHEFVRLERESRDSIRSSLEAALAKDGVPLATRNAIRGQLEWTFTAFDHTTDLDDESFEVTVHMPGIVVGGNFEERDGASVSWKFDGEGLHDRDRVLRAISVVDP